MASQKPTEQAAKLQFSHSQAERSFDSQRVTPTTEVVNWKKKTAAITDTSTNQNESSNITRLPNHNPQLRVLRKIRLQAMPAPYANRDAGDAKSKKQSMADLKLRRLQELNARLKEDLERPRVKVAEASQSLITYCNQTRDFMVPSVWGQVDKKDDPYNPQAGGSSGDGCCVVM